MTARLVDENEQEVTLVGPPANGRVLVQHADGQLEVVDLNTVRVVESNT